MIKAIPVAAPPAVTVASAAVNDAASTIASQRHTGRAGIASIKPSKSKSKFKSPDPQSNLLNSDGIEYCNRNGSSTSTGTRNVHLQYNHQETILKTPATRSKQQSVYYSARPSREAVLQRLSEALLRRSLRKIDLSQRSLQASDARLVKMALAQNANLTVLKLGYNNLGDAGVKTLAAGIVAHKSLNLLDLGFNNIGDEGIRALAHCMQKASEEQQQRTNVSSSSSNEYKYDGSFSTRTSTSSTLHTLYLAGNLIGQDGAMAMADFLRRGSRLRKLFMTGNRIGGEGVKAITDAIMEQQEAMSESEREYPATSTTFDVLQPPAAENLNDLVEGALQRENDVYSKQTRMQHRNLSISISSPPSLSSLSSSRGEPKHHHSSSSSNKNNFHGMQELYLGGTGMELTGCQAVSRLLEKNSYLRVLSLPNCDIGDEEVRMLALSIKANKNELPLESLQLSFNNITHHGLEAMANALWGSTTMRELKVDNNMIGDRGAHQMAAIIPAMKVIEVLDVGFNSITTPGLTILMKSVAESKKLLSLSLSGNAIDATAAKSVAYALAYNCSLKSIFLVHCSIGHEEQRHIAAGIVSNSRTALDRLNGFEIGSILLTLGFPEALKNWTNEQVFNFIHLMWDKHDENKNFHSDLERDLDPLSFLSDPMSGREDQDPYSTPHQGPLEASVVVEVAKRYFDSLVANGIDVTSRRPSNLNHPSIGSPLATDAIIIESSSQKMTLNPTMQHPNSHHYPFNLKNESEKIRPSQVKSFVAPPEASTKKKQEMQDPSRKKRIVEWLCSNTRPLNELAHSPFNTHELWKLHQFYFTPVVKESGGSSNQQERKCNLITSSVPEVHRLNPHGSAFMPPTPSVDDRAPVPMSDPALSGPATSSTLLKRKVSYRSLGDAISNTDPQLVQRNNAATDTISVAKIIENRHSGHSLPPKTKRARRNRTRISFLPRIKAKLDSCLDVDHEKALVTMRHLYFVERAILSGNIISVEVGSAPQTHLSGILAAEAEMIIVDLM